MIEEFSSGKWKLKKFLHEKDFIKELNRLMNIKRVSVMQYGPYGGGLDTYSHGPSDVYWYIIWVESDGS